MALEQGWVYKFNDVILLTYQQMQSLLNGVLDGRMIHRGIRGNIDHHERIGNVIANDVVSPYGQTKIIIPVNSRRAVSMSSSDAAVLIADEDRLRMMADPQDSYTQTILAALKRREDKYLLDALLGSAMTAAVTAGTGVITYGSQALPSARKIGGATAFDLARTISAATLLSKASVPNGAGERIMLYSPGQLQDILAITQASSSDFTKNQIHDRGTINGIDWEGFRWIEIADVVDPDGSTVTGRMLALASTTRSCIAFARGAAGVSSAKEITTVVDPRPDLQARPLQVRTSMIMGAVRVWEGGVVQVDSLEN